MTEKKLLKVGVIETVGLVDAGANQKSHVLIAKRAGPGNGGGVDDDEGSGSARARREGGGVAKLKDRIMAAFGKALDGLGLEEEGTMDDFDISTLPEEAREYVSQLEAARDEAVEKSEELTEQVQQLQEKVGDGSGDGAAGDAGTGDGGEGEGAAEDVLKGADPAVQKLFAKQQAELEASRKQAEEALSLAKGERDRRLDGEIAKRFEKNGDLAYLPPAGKDVTHVEVMKAIGQLPDRERKAIDRLLKAASEQIKQSALFSALGKRSDVGGGGDAFAKIETIAKDLRAKDPKLTEGEALRQAMSQNPDLAREYKNEGIAAEVS